jgi:threonine/homoserine/homoserine lactone efflux protein
MLITTLLVGTFIGFLFALIPGVVGFTAMKAGLEKGQRHGTYIAIGASIIDFFYSIIFAFTTSAISLGISKISGDYPYLVIFIQAVIVLLIFGYGVYQLRTKKKLLNIDIQTEKKEYRMISTLFHKGPFFVGIAVALTNTINPTFLPTLVTSIAFVHKFGLMEDSSLGNLFFSLGFGFGNFAWTYCLVRIILHYKSRMSDMFVARLYQFSGYILILLGTLLGYRVLVYWSSVLHFAFIF